MKKVTVSAPGKLMLFGEHAVVYNHPCLVTAVDQRMNVTIELIDSPELQLEAPDVKVTGYKKQISELGKGDMPKGAKFVEIAVKNFMEKKSPPQSSLVREGVHISSPDKGRPGGDLGLKINTRSEFSSLFGFGSSSASTVCVIKALSELFKLKLNNKDIFDLSYKTVLDIQGKGSGFDVAAAVYGGTLYFVTAGKTIKPLKINNSPLIVGYSGVKADTVTLINHVKEKFAGNNKRLQQVYSEMEEIVEKAKLQILSTNWQKVGELMNKNQKLLIELGVSIEKLDGMIAAAVKAGAYGAKLSGAGGGDCIIALAPQSKRHTVEKAITKAGGEVIRINTNAQGVKVENYD